MPIYEYECMLCEELTEFVCKIADKPSSIMCGSCGSLAKCIPSRLASVRPAWDAYLDENIADEPVMVKGRRHRQELMRREGLEEKEISPQRKREVMQKLRHIKRTGEIAKHKQRGGG